MTPQDGLAVVIRGGVGRDPDELRASLQQMCSLGERPCLSIFVEPGVDPGPGVSALEHVCRAAGARWGKVQVSTVHRLIQAGFEILDERDSDEADCHFHIEFAQPVTLLEVRMFLSAFSEPVTNPIPASERRR